MAQNLIVSLDQGTTSTRAIVFDLKGAALAEAGRPLAQSYPADGWVEHDAEAIWRASLEVLREASAKTGRMSDIAALGITNQRETVVVWDRRTGKPIHPAIVWQDRRTFAQCEALKAGGHETRVSELTGLLLDPYFSATKIAWILDQIPGARAAAEAGALAAGTMDCWLVWKLTGGAVHATDATNASRTLLFDIGRGDWSQELLDLFRVPAGLLPRVLDCADDFGEMTPDILGRAVPIRGVAGDQQAALMGQGCIGSGEMKATFGTGAFLLVNTGPLRPRSHNRLLVTIASRIAGETAYALEGSVFIAGAGITWLGEELGIEGGPQAIEALARQARADHGVVLVPAFTGLGAPWWDSEARGAIFGLTRDSGRPEIAAAMFDACALQTRDLIDAMAADAPTAFAAGAPLRLDGGMSRSAFFCQRLADLLGREVFQASYAETTALGAALFAGLGAGLYESLDQAAAARPGGTAFSPQLKTSQRNALHVRWLDAVTRTRR
ncbi:MAG: glpK [Caulobacteraceae bacterium]|nr:glpK [Caulobacteraceae bacterium]